MEQASEPAARTKKVLAIVGSPVKRATYRAVREFETGLKTRGPVDFEYLFLAESKLELCRGCRLCMDRGGEELCPSKDDRDLLLERMEAADGLVLAAPNYSFQVPALMKNFLDRFAFLFHRPRFFGKACTAIVVQGIFGGEAIRRYLESMAGNWGFHRSRGCCLRTLEPDTERQARANSRKLASASARFFRELGRPVAPPSLFKLLLFRLSRTSLRIILSPEFMDYRYFEEQGWFESDYYHETRLGLAKRAAGSLFDLLGSALAKRR
jgi:NAD(P)H-dependent FMN reductase